MYGAQAFNYLLQAFDGFENDVEMYGAQAVTYVKPTYTPFENDVEMYGAQASYMLALFTPSLRMM